MPSRIEWTEETWEVVQGCTPVSPGCDNCYAKRLAKGRLRRFYPSGFETVSLRPQELSRPYHWQRRRTVFVCSRSDLFHPRIPFDYLKEPFKVMLMNSRHTYQVLTKRPGRAVAFWERYMAPTDWPGWVWLGTSVESAKYLPRLDVLARVPARVRFVSCEPLLEPLNFDHTASGPAEISWCIVGGESGPNARPLELDWVRDIIAQCREAKIACFVKQLGTAWAKANGARDWKGANPADWPEDLRAREMPCFQ